MGKNKSGQQPATGCLHTRTQPWTIWGPPDQAGNRKAIGEETKCVACGQKVG